MSDSVWKDPYGYIGAAEEYEAEINRLNAALAAANERIREWSDKAMEFSTIASRYEEHLTAEREVLDKLVAALAFYADPEAFKTQYQGDHDNPEMIVPVAEDCGDIARTTLAEVAALRKGQA